MYFLLFIFLLSTRLFVKFCFFFLNCASSPVDDGIVFKDFHICRQNLNVEKCWVELPPLGVHVCLEASLKSTSRLVATKLRLHIKLSTSCFNMVYIFFLMQLSVLNSNNIHEVCEIH